MARALGFTAEFWTRAAVMVIYLLPLWVVLVWGMPNSQQLGLVSAGELARRALAATSFALVGIVIATGMRLSRLRAPVSSVKLESCEVLEGGAVWLRYKVLNEAAG